MSQYELLKWGVAGAGKISSDFVTACQSEDQPLHQVMFDLLQGRLFAVELIFVISNKQFVAVASRSQATAKAFADKFSIARPYGSYEELAADAEVQVVYIGNLNVDHYQTAKLFLEHGKHVLVEKPLTMNTKRKLDLLSLLEYIFTTKFSLVDTEAILKLAKSKNLFLMEALWSRFLPAYVFVAEQLKAGAIGEVLHARAEFGVPISGVDRLAKKEQGGGTILDLGVYAINLVQMAFDNEEPLEIVAVGHLNQNGIDLNVCGAFNYSHGRTATISTHSVVRLSNEATITGTKGSIRLPSLFHCTDKVIVNGVEHSFPMPPAKGTFNFDNSSGLRFEARAVRQALIEGRLECAEMPAKHSIIIANIQDEIRKQVGVDFDADHVSVL